MPISLRRQRSRRQAWIGLVHVKPESRKNRFFQGDEGAYATTLAWALDSQEYRAKVAKEAARYKMIVVGVKEIEPLAQRMSKFEVDKNIIRLAKKVRKAHVVRFDTFYSYPKKRSSPISPVNVERRPIPDSHGS